MTRFAIFKQRGVVLIFTMVMLLLLTLVTVSMIQANRQELAMSSNAMQQSTMFALAESSLVQAARALENSPVHQDSGDFQCTPTLKISSGQDVQTQILAGEHPEFLPKNAVITRATCLQRDTSSSANIGGIISTDSKAVKEILCSTYDPQSSDKKVWCYPSANIDGPGDTKEECEFIGTTLGETPIPSNDYDSVDHACYARWDTNNQTAANAKCPIEMYTVRVTADDGYGSQRIVESKYSIECGAI